MLKLKSKINIRRVISFFVGLGLFAKQFYFFSSGSLQAGDIILLLAAGISFFSLGLKICKRDYKLYGFMVFALLIDVLYSVALRSFFPSIIHLLYNLILIICLFRPFVEDHHFLRTIQVSVRLALLMQLVLILTKQGRWFGGVRYMGSFNDPNQYGFYVLCCFFIQFAIDVIQNKKMNYFWFAVSMFEIFTSTSSGMLVGFAIFVLLYFILGSDKTVLTTKRMVFLLASLVSIIGVFLFWKRIVLMLDGAGLQIIRRLTDRISNGNSNNGSVLYSFFADRELLRVVKKPIYFLFGCGEGGWYRFADVTGEIDEIHSTAISLAYCYGLIPYTFLVSWVKNNFANSKRYILFVCMALIVESFTLVNHRQPMFWLILLLPSITDAKKNTILEPVLF